MKIWRTALFTVLLTSVVVLAFGTGAIVGSKTGYEAGADNMARIWIAGCIQGMTLPVFGVTLHCGIAKKT